jgi:prepilin-type N-terminal cleavage/methylation domain-containing protein
MAFSGKRSDGFTLVELLVVVCVAALLAGLAFMSFTNWSSKYDIESQVLMLHADLMRARSSAIIRSRAHFVVLKTGSYYVAADTHPAPFGDGDLTEHDAVVLPEKVFSRPINSPSTLTFNARGMATLYRTICVYSDVKPETDCIIIHRARINTGKIYNQKGNCDSDNCRAQ